MLQPLGDRILIRPEPNPDRTDSGLHLVEHRKPETSGVVADVPSRLGFECAECGHRSFREPLVKVGDTVMFSWTSGQELHINEERYLLMRESDILAVLETEVPA